MALESSMVESKLELSPELETKYQELKKLEAQMEMAYWKFCVISGSKNPDEDEKCFKKIPFLKKLETLNKMAACAKSVRVPPSNKSLKEKIIELVNAII